MDRKALESTAANYPYLQGLWALPLGFMLPITGLSNLERRPSGPWMLGILGGGLSLCAVGWLLVARYYKRNYGEVTPTTGRRVRYAVAVAAWVAVLFVGANAVAMFPLGVAFMASGLLDQRLLARAFESAKGVNVEDSNAGR